MLTTDIREVFPDIGAANEIDGLKWENVELIAVFTRPSEGFWTDMARRLQPEG